MSARILVVDDDEGVQRAFKRTLEGAGSQPDRHVAFELGAVDYIEKPSDPRFMLGKIRRLIDASERTTSGGEKNR